MICTKLKTGTFVLLMLAFGGLNAQLILTIPNDTIFIALDTLDTEEIVDHWDVSNDTFMSLELMCSRNYLSTVTPYNYPYIQSLPENPVAGAYEKFCWGPLCYNYGTDASSTNSSLLVNIPSGATDSTFIAYFYPNDVLGTTTIEYCFHPVGDLSGGNCGSITYVVTATAAVELMTPVEMSISAVYPNPLVDKGSIDFSIPQGSTGTIIIRDVTGKILSETTDLVMNGSIHLESSDFMAGIFFSTLVVDGHSASTRRFVVIR